MTDLNEEESRHLAELVASTSSESVAQCMKVSRCDRIPLAPCDIAAEKGAIEAVLRRAFADVTVWSCRVIGEVWLDADDVIALVRDHAPEWLERNAEVAHV